MDRKQLQQSTCRKIKLFCFRVLLTFQKYRFKGDVFLFIFDFLEIFTLHYLYVNLFYTHIANLDYIRIYFELIYPYFYMLTTNHTQSLITNNIVIFLFPLAFFLMILGMKIKFTIIIYFSQLIFVLFPLVIFRFTAQIIQIGKYSSTQGLIAYVLVFITVFVGVNILLQYQKLVKITDFIVGMMILLQIHEYAIFGALGLRLLLYAFLAPDIHAKKIKFWFEVALFLSLLLLLFLPQTTINYFMIACLLVFLPLSHIFIGIKLLEKNLHEMEMEEDVEDISNVPFEMNQINYIRKIQEHRSVCMLLQCDCQSISIMKTVKKLQKWARNFRKEELKIKEDFDSKIEYARVCFQTENLNFSGLFYLIQRPSQTLRQQFYEYSIKLQYEEYLKSMNTKLIVDYEGQFVDIREQIIEFEEKLVDLVEDIVKFWLTLSGEGNLAQSFNLIMKIQKQIDNIKDYYDEIMNRYDEALQIEFFYSIFEKFVLRTKSEDDKDDNFGQEAFIITEQQKIIQASYKTCRLFHIEHEDIVGTSCHKFMPQPYIEKHSKWVQEFIEKYSPKSEETTSKIVSTNSIFIRTTCIKNSLIPRFSDGIQILSKFTHFEDEKKEVHFLLKADTLQVIGYDENLFHILEINLMQVSEDQLKHKTITDFFPNVNKESIEKVKKKFCPAVKIYYKKILQLIKIYNNREHTFLEKQKESESELKFYTFKYEFVNSKINQELQIVLLKFTLIQSSEMIKRRPKNKRMNTTYRPKQEEKMKSEKPKSQNFHYITVIISVISIIMINTFCFLFQVENRFTDENLITQDQQLLYFKEFVETCLFYMDVSLGYDKYDEIRNLWIQGFDTKSKPFNIFQNIEEQLFDNQLYSQLISIRQVQLYKTHQVKLGQNIQFVQRGLIFLEIVFLIVILLILINFIVGMIAIVSLQKEIKETLTKFSLLQTRDIYQTLDKFETETKFLYSNLFETSLNNEESDILQVSLRDILDKPKKKEKVRSKGKKRKAFLQCQNLQLQNTNNAQDSCVKVFVQEQQSIKRQKKLLDFKKKSSIMQIVSDNCSHFLTPFLANLTFSFVIIVLFIFMHGYLTSFVNCFEISSRIYFESTLFLQKFQEKYLNIQIYPSFNISSYHLETTQKIEDLPIEFIPFKIINDKMDADNMCIFLEDADLLAKCMNSSGIYNYGFKTIFQHLEEDFRQVPSGNYTITNQTIDLVEITSSVFEKRKEIYQQTQTNYFSGFYMIRRYMYIFTIVFLCLGGWIQNKRISHFKARLVKTMDLFIFVPDKLKRKMNQNQIEQNEEEIEKSV